MRIREAILGDNGGIVDIETNSGYHKIKYNPLPMIKDIFKDKKKSIFIAIEEKEIFGYIAVNIKNKICDIILFGVHKKYQRKGIGKKLIEYVLRLSKKLKLRKIILDVRENNLKARNLYSKYGFVVVRKIKKGKPSFIKLKMERVLK